MGTVLATAAAYLSTAATAASVYTAADSLLNKPDEKKDFIPFQPGKSPADDEIAIQEAAAREKKLLQKRRGFKSTILTQGDQGSVPGTKRVLG